MSNQLSGGRRRRRPAQLVASVVLLLAPLVVGAAAYLALASDDAGGGSPGLAIAVHRPPGRHPSAAAVALGRGDAFPRAPRKPPRADLVFDVGSGDVLWRHAPTRVLPIAS